MMFFLPLVCAAAVAGARLNARQAVDPNDDVLNDDWYLDALEREADGPGANATGSASFSSHNLTRSNLDEDAKKINWEIELLVFANITVKQKDADAKQDQTGSVLRYMPQKNETISDDHFVCAAGFVVDGNDHELGTDDDLDEDCSNALPGDCLDWLRKPGVSLCSPGNTPPSSCNAGNRYMNAVRNGTASTSDPPALWLNQAFGDDDDKTLSGNDAYDHVIRQLYVATWGVYSTTQNEEGDKMPGGDQKDYSLKCLRADDIRAGSRTMEDTASAMGPRVALIVGLALAITLL